VDRVVEAVVREQEADREGASDGGDRQGRENEPIQSLHVLFIRRGDVGAPLHGPLLARRGASVPADLSAGYRGQRAAWPGRVYSFRIDGRLELRPSARARRLEGRAFAV